MRWVVALTMAMLVQPISRVGAAEQPISRVGAAEQAGAARSMQGGCEEYSWDMRREMTAWEEPALPLSALTEGSSAADPVPLDRRLDLTLHALAQVRFAAPPERTRAGGYAGLVSVAVPVDGVYRISSGSRLWIDVVEGTQPVASAKFEGHAGCAKVHKVVAFPLKANRSYRVQLSGSEKPAVSILVTADR